MLKVEIHLIGNIPFRLLGCLGDLNITHSGADETILMGIISDRDSFYEIISHLRDLGLQLSSVFSEDLLDQNPP